MSMSITKGVVAELIPKAWPPLSPLLSGHANDPGSAEGRETGHECDADVDFGGLAGRVSACAM